eukprot:scaffold80589_cov66-Cyclotella_meneghiniana.AAC.1
MINCGIDGMKNQNTYGQGAIVLSYFALRSSSSISNPQCLPSIPIFNLVALSERQLNLAYKY